MMSESREHRRFSYDGTVLLQWKAGGEDKYTRGHAVNVSRSGMKLIVSEPIPYREFVNLRADEIQIAGSACVRHCERFRGKFMVGLEFTRGLRWPEQTAPGLTAKPQSPSVP